jgi:hypothetical protein
VDDHRALDTYSLIGVPYAKNTRLSYQRFAYLVCLYILLLDDKDIENSTVRRRTEGDLGAMSLEAALTLFAQYRDA